MTDDTTAVPEMTWADFPAKELYALAAAMGRNREWVSALRPAWIAAKNGGWSAHRAYTATCVLIGGLPDDHPRDITNAVQRTKGEAATAAPEDEKVAEALAETRARIERAREDYRASRSTPATAAQTLIADRVDALGRMPESTEPKGRPA